jgi:4-carboxymuconolactone decarboxylase
MTGLPPLGRFPGLAPERMTAEQVDLAAAFTRRRGAIPGPYKIWLTNAAFAARQKSLSDHLLRSGLLSPREAEIAILVTARKLDAPFIAAAHRRLAAAAGLPAAAIEAICAGTPPALEDARERIVYEAARAMHEERPPERALFDRAVGLLGHDGLSELAGLLGFYCACAFTLTFYAAEPSV